MDPYTIETENLTYFGEYGRGGVRATDWVYGWGKPIAAVFLDWQWGDSIESIDINFAIGDFSAEPETWKVWVSVVHDCTTKEWCIVDPHWNLNCSLVDDITPIKLTRDQVMNSPKYVELISGFMTALRRQDGRIPW